MIICDGKHGKKQIKGMGGIAMRGVIETPDGNVHYKLDVSVEDKQLCSDCFAAVLSNVNFGKELKNSPEVPVEKKGQAIERRTNKRGKPGG